MKSNKGFTLVELLAVIVILAIIALIATPSILNVVDKARKGSAESSALGYVDAVEKQVMINEVEGTNKFDLSSEQDYSIDDLTGKGVSVKGELPSGDTDSVTVGTTGEVTGATLTINGYTVTYAKDANGKYKATATK